MFYKETLFIKVCYEYLFTPALSHINHLRIINWHKHREYIIDWFIKDQGFSPSYDLAPPPPFSRQ